MQKKLVKIIGKFFTENGREKTGKNVVDWAKEANSLGIGEILLTSVDKDGTLNGPDINLVNNIKKS